MKRFQIFTIVFLMALFMVGLESYAQNRIVVTGTITNKTDDNKPLIDVVIYAYKTVAEAESAYKSYMLAKENSGFFDPGLTVCEYPNNDGYYEINAVKTGALMFDPMGLADPIVVPVDCRKVIDVVFDAATTLDNSAVSAEEKGMPVLDPHRKSGKKGLRGAPEH